MKAAPHYLGCPDPSKFDVVFVIGLHKSGTSLFTEQLSNYFLDVSRITNPLERGYGNAKPRYLTRECKITRGINESYRRYANRHYSFPRHSCDKWKKERDGMREYLESWSVPFVIKAPFFGYSLNHWLEASEMAGLKPCVCFIFRDLSQVLKGWRGAPFTRKMLMEGEFWNLKRCIDMQIGQAKASGVEVRTIAYNRIRECIQAT